MTTVITFGLSDPWQWRLLWTFERPEPFTYGYSVAALNPCMYRITAVRSTEPQNCHGWQRPSTFPLLLSVKIGGKFVQTTQALPSTSKAHQYVPDNSKCIDSGCSMMIDIYRGDGGISPRFLNFGTSCRWAVSFPRWFLYVWHSLAGSWWTLETFWICLVWFVYFIARISPHTFHQLVFVMEANSSLWVTS